MNIHFLKEENSMAYVITDACVSCGTCEGECPVGAISAGDGKIRNRCWFLRRLWYMRWSLSYRSYWAGL